MTVDYPRALLAALTVTVVVAVAVAAGTSGAAFGLYNPGWDGTSDLRGIAEDAGAEVTVARNVSAYADVAPNGTVAVVLAPGSAYGPGEAAAVRSFLEAGGTLLVADDVAGPANDLLSDVGASARLDGRRLRDDQHHYRGPALPVAGDVADHAYTRDVDALTLNHGTAVVPRGARPVANTSELAYLDADGDGAIGDGEPIGPFPVATVEPVGDGRVVVVGDPSALINAMLDRPGNRAFAAALFSAHERALLDVSHAGALPPAAYALLVLRESVVLQLLVGAAAVCLVGLWAMWPRVGPGRPAALEQAARRFPGWLPAGGSREPPGLPPAALAAELRRRHPEWDRERVERVVEEVLRGRERTAPGERGRN